MRLSIQQQVAAGHLTPESATDLQKKVDEFEQKFTEGNTREAAKKARDLREKITNCTTTASSPTTATSRSSTTSAGSTPWLASIPIRIPRDLTAGYMLTTR
jgi:hypothetical protein